MPLTSQAYSIQSIYEWYKKDLLIVNRKYQRKLVWSIEEKKMLVDSLLQDFPLPLFLLSKKSEKYEIIDGMQRLNSIFAFIEGEFPILKDKKDLYFDLSTLGSTKQLLDEGKLKQKEPTLDRSICVEFSNYQVAISIVESSEEERIEEIFRRINSYGKHLSPQEIRQAGALGLFSDLVRRLSAIIRRDSSPSDILTLGNMQKISLSTRCLDYGVKIDDVFWIKHKIITPSNLRSSRDEELIAHILLKILREEPCHTTKASDLDKVYADSKEKNFIEKKIQNRSGLEDEFIKIFEQIEFFLGCSDKSLENILYSKGSNGGMTIIFQILFLSMYELIIVEQKEITNPDGIIAALDGVGDELIKKPQECKYNASVFGKYVKALKGIVNECFGESLSKNKLQESVNSGIVKIEQILQESKVEQPMYDFKIGLYSIKNPQKNDSCISKIIKTLTAMGNTHPGENGYVLLGIADDRRDADQLCSQYNMESKEFNGHYIVGVEKEAEKVHQDLDAYLQYLKQEIEKEPISESVKSHILRNIRYLCYHEHTIVLMTFSSDAPVLYDGKYYERRGANVHELSPEEIVSLTRRFPST